ncbi:Succinate dehydrogenase/fumarate reductase, flavoprotein subunit [Roseomonas rosea]|uniref:Succinate dehydrogenase/fumarate reductase, flavoprotein subunit n=1 Tax=Muricoccus roseus TaxID=198092 RepID=A0A1M6LSY2_9PROT|nr:FAD-dependent oxidoreductase [Roseomonas rosea]SHJ74324.1 Succinate dehydrogenase/fumarate reductase, flavoprotein subunit [Roseomonas rosea]
MDGRLEAAEEGFDVVVLGSGAAGLAAAITARAAGLSVLLLEKTGYFGGSTAVSGGAVWIPSNPGMAELGHEDSREKVMAYLRGALGNHLRPERIEAFLDHGPEMVRFLEREAGLRLIARAVSPDYQPEREGGMPGGRAMDPAEFDGRRLGPLFEALRPPLPIFLALGGMMVNRKDIDSLLRPLSGAQAFRHAAGLLARHARDRLRWRRGTRLVLGNALAGHLLWAADRAGVVLRRQVTVTGLRRRGGRVDGVVVEEAGRTCRIGARWGVVLATGGFPRNAAMRAERMPHAAVHRSMSPEGNAGDGIALARAVGAAMEEAGAGPAFWTPVSVLRRPDGGETVFPHLVTDRQKPGLMAVDGTGRRFVNEATSYHGFVEGMHRAGAVPAWLVCDRRFLRRYGLGMLRPGSSPRALVRAGYLIEATDLGALAARIGVPPAALAESVARMNEAARRGEDPEFHRGASAYDRYLGDPAHRPNPCLGPIEAAPFYAVQVWPGDIGTASGLRVDGRSRVLDEAGEPVPGLFACGNDAASVMAGTYPGAGITLGPGLTFGYVAGRELAAAAGGTSA